MSVKPPQHQISPFVMVSPTDDISATDRNPFNYSMDSVSVFSESADSWVCPRCSYLNVDANNERCAMCGNKDHHHGSKRANFMSTVAPPLSLPDSDPSDSDEEVCPPPTELGDRQATAVMSNSSRNAPLIRSAREEDEDDISQPSKPLSSRSHQEPLMTTKPPASPPTLSGPSLGAMIRSASLEQDRIRTPSRSQSTPMKTTHSVDTSSEETTRSAHTVRTSNRSAPPPPDSSETPLRSNTTRSRLSPKPIEPLTHSPRHEQQSHRYSRAPVYTIPEDTEQASSQLTTSTMRHQPIRVDHAARLASSELVPPIRRDSRSAPPVHQHSNSGHSDFDDDHKSVYTIQTNATSHVSDQSSFADERSMMERGVRPNHPVRTADTREKDKRALWIFVMAAVIIFATALAVIVVAVSGKHSKTSSLPTQPTSSPSLIPTGGPTQVEITLSAVATLSGSDLDLLGTSVSVGGPQGNWVAMVGDQFVRVARLMPSQDVEVLGKDIVLDAPITRVSLSAERRRVALSFGGQMAVYQLEADSSKWQTLLEPTSIDKVPTNESPMDTSCSISGSGMVVAGAAILPNGATNEVVVHTVEYDSDNAATPLLPIRIPVKEVTQSAHVELSYDGDVMAILMDNGFAQVYGRQGTMGWGPLGGQPVVSIESFVVYSMALSGNGNILALAGSDETIVFEHHEEEDSWEEFTAIGFGGMDISLSHDGDFALIGSTMESEVVTLWTRESESYQLVQEIQGESSSQFGAAVSIPKNREWHYVAVGAPATGKKDGNVHLYEL